MDLLTTKHTAFQSWAEFLEAVQGGYCPTLRRKGGRLHLGMALTRLGHRVFWRV